MKKYWKHFIDKWLTTRLIAIVLLGTALILGRATLKSEIFLQDYVPNIVTEFIGIAITILLIEELNERREKKNLRDRLKRELWSKDQGIALRAVNELREHGWLTDGGLENINLPYSVLDRAELKGVIMNGANLYKASLQRAYIGYAKLKNINFSNANLNSAILNHSDLTGSNFTNAILDNVSLEDVNLVDAKITNDQINKIKSLKGSIMPDGMKYEDWLKKRKQSKVRKQSKK